MREFKSARKQGMQLARKMRFPAVQMEALFTDDLPTTSDSRDFAAGCEIELKSTRRAAVDRLLFTSYNDSLPNARRRVPVAIKACVDL